MNEQVLEFSQALRTKASRLGIVKDVEWRLSGAPVPYLDAVGEMEARVAAIAAGAAPELIWFLEHPPLYTAGASAKIADLLDATRFPVFEAGRGGQYTYHGPGQLVAYVMFDLNRRGRDVRRFVNRLEDWIIAALAEYEVRGQRRDGHPGIWVETADCVFSRDTAEQSGVVKPCIPATEPPDAKIAALGVRVRRWITYHGIAVNICPDLSHFEGIVPCGIAGAGVTSLAMLHRPMCSEPLLKLDSHVEPE